MLRKLLLCLALLLAACGTGIDLSIQAPATFSLEPEGFETATVTACGRWRHDRGRYHGSLRGPRCGRRSDRWGSAGSADRRRYPGIGRPEASGWLLRQRGLGGDGRIGRGGRGSSGEGRRGIRWLRSVAALCLSRGRDGERSPRRQWLRTRVHLSAQYSLSELFVQLESEAREGSRGLWSPDTCSGRDSPK